MEQQEKIRFSVLPYKKKKIGIVTTGSEVQKGLVKDTFTPVLKDKFARFPSEVIGQTIPGDDKEQITSEPGNHRGRCRCGSLQRRHECGS